MGCWNATCGLSNLPIRAGDQVVAMFISIPQIQRDTADSHLGPISPASACFIGKYDDYGSIEEIEFNLVTNNIAKQFGYNKDGFCDLLDDVVQCDKMITVPNDMLDYYENVVRHMDEALAKGEKLDERVYDKEGIKRFRNGLEEAKKYPENIGLWMCRKDYLDRMMNTKTRWAEYTKCIQRFKISDALKFDQDYIKGRIKEIINDDLKWSEDFFLFSSLLSGQKEIYGKEGQYSYSNYDMFCRGPNDVRFSKAIIKQFEEALRDQRQYENSDLMNEMLDSLGYLASIVKIMFATRKRFVIQSHAGSQAENYDAHMLAAKTAAAILKAEIKERNKQAKVHKEQVKKYLKEEKEKQKQKKGK